MVSSLLILPALHLLIQCGHERRVSKGSGEVASNIEVHHWLEVLEATLLEEAQDVDLERERVGHYSRYGLLNVM